MNLQLVKSDKFGETECDIYSDSKEMYSTQRRTTRSAAAQRCHAGRSWRMLRISWT